MQDWVNLFYQFKDWITAESSAWTVVGYIATAIFGGRFVLQWYVSEKLKKSVIPVAFWYMSIFGSILMLIYSIHVWKAPLVLANLFPAVVYIRNLMLIEKGKKSSGLSVAEPKKA